MERMDQHQAKQRGTGPFVTAGGRRLPVRTLSYADVPGLIEFSDYLARGADAPDVLGWDRAALEQMTETQFDAHTVIAVIPSPRSLIRGVGAYEHTASQSANVRFTVDDSLLRDGVFCEMVYRIADDAREHHVTELRAVGGTQGAEQAAFAASGFPAVAGAAGLAVDITEYR